MPAAPACHIYKIPRPKENLPDDSENAKLALYPRLTFRSQNGGKQQKASFSPKREYRLYGM